MFQGTYKKILLVVLLFAVVIYGLRKVAQYNTTFSLHEKLALKVNLNQINRQQPNLQPGIVKQSNEKPQSLSNLIKIDQFTLNLVKNLSKFSAYLEHLSSLQVEDLVRQLGVSNLTSRKVQEEFLKCGGMLTLRQLKDPLPETPIPVIPSHQHCKNMSFKSSGPVVSLSSVPGSGNSWVRQLLESATGIYTGSVWCDSSYVNAGMIGEGVDTNNVLGIKLHYYNAADTKRVLNNDKSIYIVRSPFGAILSEHTRNVARNSEKYLSLGDSHVIEVDFKYGMLICSCCT